MQLQASISPIEPQPSADPKVHLRQLHALTAAYQSLTSQEPWLPSRDSPLPALLALRATDKAIKETRECIPSTDIDFEKMKKRLEKEQADFTDAKLIQTDIQTRIISLEGEIQERKKKSPGQIAKGLIREMKAKKDYYDVETSNLVKEFNTFIDGYLAPMLAVEELGGPIVGEMLDVNEDLLGGAFNAQGKAKKVKPNNDKRQRRIDQIWGPRPEEGRTKEPWNEKRAAAAEMRDLTEQLLNNLVDADGNGPGPYVELQRESAAARFLVRSKVAQFHPNDARKVRLVDFGGEIDD